jgi:hypothetical protein
LFELVRAELDQAAFERAWADGRTLSAEGALALALDHID